MCTHTFLEQMGYLVASSIFPLFSSLAHSTSILLELKQKIASIVERANDRDARRKERIQNLEDVGHQPLP